MAKSRTLQKQVPAVGYKLAPLERSVVEVLKQRPCLTMKEVAAAILYLRQDSLEEHFAPVLRRLICVGILRTDTNRRYCLER